MAGCVGCMLGGPVYDNFAHHAGLNRTVVEGWRIMPVWMACDEGVARHAGLRGVDVEGIVL